LAGTRSNCFFSEKICAALRISDPSAAEQQSEQTICDHQWLFPTSDEEEMVGGDQIWWVEAM
jgi:hypothetical protein